MGNYHDAVSKLFVEKENLIIVGLTGRTGAGCTTASEILGKEYGELDLEYKNDNDTIEDQLKFDIIKNYISADERWIPFTRIEGSCVILSYVFEQGDSNNKGSDILIQYLTELQSIKNEVAFKIDNFPDLINELHGLEDIFEVVKKEPLTKGDVSWSDIDEDSITQFYDLYIHKMPKYKERLKRILLKYTCYEERKKKLQDEPPVKFHLYTYLLQKIANNIRASGNPYDDTFFQNKIFSFAERLEKIINLIIKYDKDIKESKSRICIDAIRNVNESNYLKDKYRPYFLISISVDEETRRKRLASLDVDEQNSLDNVEYNSKLEASEFFYHQNIANCFEMADIHLVNEEEKNGRKFFLTWQLVRYITLMIHPGLITPSAIERCMQLAYNVKYNSGCLSRQVGAVVTDSDFAIKSVGWNEVPEGQMSCNLRNIDGYCRGNQDRCYSQFENEDATFKKVMSSINKSIGQIDLHGRKFSYCFKDIYNGYKNERNQVHTRSLHAEENAFLQISRYGGQGIRGGNLFCTASPCELCAKKAYQLGIKNIYYIDPYPAISEKHILSFGRCDRNPKMNLFHGVIGEAYIRLYKPLLPYKDELELVSGIKCKEEAKRVQEGVKRTPDTKDLLYHYNEITLEFKNRENIESSRKVDIEVRNGTFSTLYRQVTWTGSTYDKAELIDNQEGYTLIDSEDRVSPYKYEIQLNRDIQTSERIKYHIKMDLKDETHLMHPYFAHAIKHPTDKLILNVIIPKTLPLIEDVRYVRYADLVMECEYTDSGPVIKETEDDEKVIYTLEIDQPNLYYTYSIEWDFINIKS